MFVYFIEGCHSRTLLTQIIYQQSLFYFFISKDKNLAKAQQRLNYATLIEPQRFKKIGFEILKSQTIGS